MKLYCNILAYIIKIHFLNIKILSSPLLIFMFFVYSIVPARADQPLIVSLDSHIVAISIDFTGSDVLLFGSTQNLNGDIIVTIQGPRKNVIIRKKKQTFGIWHNSKSIEIENVPGYYAIKHTDLSLSDLSEGTLIRHEIGLNNLNFQLKKNQTATKKEFEEIKQSLIDIKKNDETFVAHAKSIDRLGNNLFRTTFSIPVNAPIGTYTVQTFLVENGEIISAQSVPLFVSKTGVEAQIFNFAHQHSIFYGIFAIIFAIFAGYSANLIFRHK